MSDLIERLNKVECGGSSALDGCVRTCWHRNPDGPEAASRIISLEEEVGALRTLLEWYADQMCEGLCEKDPRLAERIGCENCAGCPARAALSIRGEG